MELRHLRYFVSVAEEENVSRAALKLHLSQPALSRQIRDLEDELGFELFQRSAKSVKLTDAGRVFLSEARAVLQRADEAIKTARMIAKGGGELHVGYAPSLTSRILPPGLRGFQSKVPQVRVKLHDLSTDEMLSGIRNDRLQIAFLVKPMPSMLRGVQFEELTRESICLAVAPNHKFARKRVVTLAEAVKEPFVSYSRNDYPEAYEQLMSIFASSKEKPRIVEEHDGAASLVAAVEAGSGVAIVARSMRCVAGPRLKLMPLSPEPPPLVIGSAWPKKGISETASQFLTCIRAAIAEEPD